MEFKSDGGPLSDSDLIAAVVCLANTSGGHIYVGVEDDGAVTGLHPKHANVDTLAAFIANRTNPSLSVETSLVTVEDTDVVCIGVPRSERVVATSEGLIQRRRLRSDGTPECVPYYPHEMLRRESDLGALDYSALPIRAATAADLDPLERARLRRIVQGFAGDAALGELTDEELDLALGLLVRHEDVVVPTVAGMLLIGQEASIVRLVPTHEVAFQVLDGTEVRVNDFYRTPLLRTFERVVEQFTARLTLEELQVGMFRIDVPNFDSRAFREAFVNALVHRDYTRMAAVYVRWELDGIVISSPGGLLEGVNLANLLTVEPRPRNRLLADIFKRLGLTERTGRGVDLIFDGLLRYGRSGPDYSRTDEHTVVVRLPGGEADLEMARLVVQEENRRQSRLPVAALIALSELRRQRRLDTRSLSIAMQRDEASARSVLEQLVEAGLVSSHGATRGRTYTLSPVAYRSLGHRAEYVRQAGFSELQGKQMIQEYVTKHGRITRRDVVDLCGVSSDQAKRILNSLQRDEILDLVGKGRGAYYIQGARLSA